MRFAPKNREFSNTDELLAFFAGLSFAPNERIAIAAGHFMLMYDSESDSLVPMIYQDARNGEVESFSQKMAGDFPTLTFKLGILLFKQLRAKQLDPSVLLAVNDHKFQSGGFQSRHEQLFKIEGKVAQLRRSFYQQADLPKSFKQILENQNLTPGEVILRNDSPNTDKARLGKKTLFFSEKAMRNTFDRRLLKQLRKDSRFRYEHRPTQDDPASYALYYRNDVAHSEVCLTEDGSCGCAGELLEFYLELQRAGFSKLFFFVPQECVNPVNVGTFISITHSTPGLSVFTISGLGGMGIGTNGKMPVEVSIH